MATVNEPDTAARAMTQLVESIVEEAYRKVQSDIQAEIVRYLPGVIRGLAPAWRLSVEEVVSRPGVIQITVRRE